jgi:hypothetical protein
MAIDDRALFEDLRKKGRLKIICLRRGSGEGRKGEEDHKKVLCAAMDEVTGRVWFYELDADDEETKERMA